VAQSKSTFFESVSDGDLPLLERLMGNPTMTEHLSGPETPEKIRERHERDCRSPRAFPHHPQAVAHSPQPRPLHRNGAASSASRQTGLGRVDRGLRRDADGGPRGERKARRSSSERILYFYLVINLAWVEIF